MLVDISVEMHRGWVTFMSYTCYEGILATAAAVLCSADKDEYDVGFFVK